MGRCRTGVDVRHGQRGKTRLHGRHRRSHRRGHRRSVRGVRPVGIARGKTRRLSDGSNGPSAVRERHRRLSRYERRCRGREGLDHAAIGEVLVGVEVSALSSRGDHSIILALRPHAVAIRIGRGPKVLTQDRLRSCDRIGGRDNRSHRRERRGARPATQRTAECSTTTARVSAGIARGLRLR